MRPEKANGTKATRLTEELLGRVYREIPDPGPIPGVAHHDDADWEVEVGQISKGAPAGEPLRVFAYGSLIWDPEYEIADTCPGTVYGWHRAFRMRIERYRACRDIPGMMLTIDRGGACRGLVHEVASDDHAVILHRLVRREMITKPCNYVPRWLKVRTARGDVRALTFVANPGGWSYEGDLTLAQIADRMARACGHAGTNAEYLMNTNRHLETLGIHDRMMRELEAMVVARIEEAYPAET